MCFCACFFLFSIFLLFSFFLSFFFSLDTYIFFLFLFFNLVYFHSVFLPHSVYLSKSFGFFFLSFFLSFRMNTDFASLSYFYSPHPIPRDTFYSTIKNSYLLVFRHQKSFVWNLSPLTPIPHLVVSSRHIWQQARRWDPSIYQTSNCFYHCFLKTKFYLFIFFVFLFIAK